MAHTPVGFVGTISDLQLARFMRLASPRYVVGSATDWTPTVVGGVDRTVQIATGEAWICGVHDTTNATENLQCAANGGGSDRYDLIVARVLWASATVSFQILQGVVGAGVPLTPTRILTGGTPTYEAPVAVCKVRPGVGAFLASDLFDVRVYGGVAGPLVMPQGQHYTVHDLAVGGQISFLTGGTVLRTASGWAPGSQGVIVISSASELATIANPYNGMLVYNTALDIIYKRAAGAWHLAVPISYPTPAQTGFGTLTANTTATVATVAIPDLGVPYRVKVWGKVGTTTPVAGNPASIQATHGSAVWDTNRIGTTDPGIGYVAGLDCIPHLPPQLSAALSGAKDIRLLARAGANTVTVVNGTYYTMGVEAHPAIPV